MVVVILSRAIYQRIKRRRKQQRLLEGGTCVYSMWYIVNRCRSLVINLASINYVSDHAHNGVPHTRSQSQYSVTPQPVRQLYWRVTRRLRLGALCMKDVLLHVEGDDLGSFVKSNQRITILERGNIPPYHSTPPTHTHTPPVEKSVCRLCKTRPRCFDPLLHALSIAHLCSTLPSHNPQ